MVRSTFEAKLESIQRRNQSHTALLIAPRIEKMPYGIMRYDEPFLPFGKAIIDASKALVSAYVFDLAAYMALGAVGMVALERTIDYAGQDVITILHGAFGSPDFALVSDENAYGVDAVTIVQGVMPTRFMERQDRMAFILDSGTPTDSTDGVGRWWINHDLMRLNEHSLHVTTEAFLYKHRHEQFRQALREELEALRHG